MFQDRNLTCADCAQEFVFTTGEQEFYSSKQFTDPRRCGPCRAARKSARSGSDSGGSYSGGSYSSGRQSSGREMFEAVCSTCGGVALVPFQPTSGKPVYCSNCFNSRS